MKIHPSRHPIGALCTAIVIACTSVVAALIARDTPPDTAATNNSLTAHAIPCGYAPISSVVGRVARLSPQANASQLKFGAAPLATSATGTLYLVDRSTPSLPSGLISGPVSIPSKRSAFRSCNYGLSDNNRDTAFKTSAESAFYARGLVAPNRFTEPGIIWMVADDPTSSTDLLVLVDVETPLTATSPGTITTLVADVDLASGKVLGANAANW